MGICGFIAGWVEAHLKPVLYAGAGAYLPPLCLQQIQAGGSRDFERSSLPWRQSYACGGKRFCRQECSVSSQRGTI